MSDTNPQDTLDTNAPEFRLNRFDAAWMDRQASDAMPDWRRHLPADDEPCSPTLIADLLQIDIECRIKAGLPALLAERYLDHPRLQKEDARLTDEQRMELIRWEYHQRWQCGQRPQRTEYEAAFPQHAEAVRQMEPQWRCPRCRKLFDLEETNQTLRCPDCDSAPPAINADPPTELDLRNYKLLVQLGKGAMGEVYRAGDPSLGRDLAIKVMAKDLRGHPVIERRFLREARITGSLQHPGIVPIHNLGRLADGRLHYTMRLVRGRTFADILKEEGGKPERLPYLLSIFEKICQAVAYAHSKRVIHRDLKPLNVMVGKFGEVQVMDWGLAKALTPDDARAESEETTDAAGTHIFTESAETPIDLSRMGSGMGTLAYMPPEQALGEWDTVDERADVFALGSILCEILTGQPAYSGTDGNEIYRRAKRGDVAEALERLETSGADAALLALCRECLNPKPEGRPRDADAVAKRVAEHQAEVQERLRQAEVERAEAQLRAREGRKQRRLLIALVLALLTGGALSTWQAVRATRERDEKEIALGKEKAAAEEERKAKEVAQTRLSQIDKAKDVLESIFSDLDPNAEKKDGRSLREQLSQHLERAAKQLDEGAVGDAVTVAHLQTVLAKSLNNLGRAKLAIELLVKAGTTLESKLGPDHTDTLIARNNLASAYDSAGRRAEAIPLFEQTFRQFNAKLGADHPETLKSRNNLAVAYGDAGRILEAIRLLEQNLRLMEAKLGADHPDTLTSVLNLAAGYRSADRTSEAIPLLERTLGQMESNLGVDHTLTLSSRYNLASAYRVVGRTTEAIRMHEQNLKQMEVKLGPDHPHTLLSRSALASAYGSVGRSAEAIRLNEQNLKMSESKLGMDHPDTLNCRHNLAVAYWSARKLDRSVPLLEETLKLQKDKLGPDHPETLQTMANLGVNYRDVGRFNDAISLLEEALERCRKRSGGIPAQLARFRGALGEAYDRNEQYAKSETIYRDFLEQTRRKLGSDDPRTARQMALLGFNLLRQNKCIDAEPLLRDCLKVRAAKEPDAWGTFNARSLLGAALLGQKKYTEAEPLLLQGYEGMKARQAKIPPQSKVRLTEALERLVQLYEATEQKDKAADWRKKLQETKVEQKKPKP